MPFMLAANSRLPKARYSRAQRAILTLLFLLAGADEAMSQSASGARRGPQAPEFVLLGTSRVGERYSAMLRHRDGSHVRVVSTSAESASISGYSDFSVARIESGFVVIQRPDNSPCVAYPGFGVGCLAGNLTALELPVASPASAALNAPVTAVPDAAGDFADLDAEPGSFIESIQVKAEQRGEKPEIPAGMQLIETSSGYRLVPED